MIRTPPSPAPTVKTLEQQNTDFTAEGSPPPGNAETAILLKAAADTPAAVSRAARGRTRTHRGANLATAPKLPHERDESINTAGTISSEPMKQAARDVKRGLADTDRGAEAGRTYKKLKQTQ